MDHKRQSPTTSNFETDGGNLDWSESVPSDHEDGAVGGLLPSGVHEEGAVGGRLPSSEQEKGGVGGLLSPSDHEVGAVGGLVPSSDLEEGAVRSLLPSSDQEEGAVGGLLPSSDHEKGAVGGLLPSSDQEEGAVGGLLPTPIGPCKGGPVIPDSVFIGVNLYLRNLSSETSGKELVAVLCQIGKINHFKLIVDHNGISRGIAFVHFDSERAANEARARLHHQYLSGRLIEAEVVRIDYGIILNVFNLDERMGNRKLKQSFEEFGRIKEAKVVPNNHDGKRVGIVHYADPNDAIDAMVAMHKVNLYSRTITVDIAAVIKPVRPVVVPTLIATPAGLIPGPWTTLPILPPSNRLPNQKLKKSSKKSKVYEEMENKDYVSEPLTLDMLKGKSWQRQKLMFAERLCPLVNIWHRKYVEPIVTLLILKSNDELWKMLRDEEYLQNQVDEAYLKFKNKFLYRTILE